MKPSIENLGPNYVIAAAELESRALLQALPRVHQCLPHFGGRVARRFLDAPEQQAFGGATAGQAAAQQTSGKNLGIVDHQKITGIEEGRQIQKTAIAKRTG